MSKGSPSSGQTSLQWPGTLVQAKAWTANRIWTSDSPITLNLPNSTYAGNCLIVCSTTDTTPTGVPTLTDNLSSGIWSTPTISSHSSAYLCDIFVATNVPAGINQIQITHPGGSPQNNQYSIYEFYNVVTSSALDGTSHNDAVAGPSPTAGSLTTTQDGDLIFTYAMKRVTGGTNAISYWSPGTGMELLNAANLNAQWDIVAATQFGIQRTAGAINPSMTANGTTSGDTFQVLALALKCGRAGTAPKAGIRIVNVQGYNFYGANAPSGPWTMQFPTRGNLVHLSDAGWLPNDTNQAHWVGMSGVSDTAGNSYTLGAVSLCPTDIFCGYTQHAHGQGGAPSNTNQITFNAELMCNVASGGSFDCHLHLECYDISNAAKSALDTRNITQGNQTTDDKTGAVSSLTTSTITPSNPSSLVIETTGIDQHNLSGVLGTGQMSVIGDAPNYNGSGSGLSTDCGFGHKYCSDTSAVTFIYSVQQQGTLGYTGVQGWSSAASSYKRD